MRRAVASPGRASCVLFVFALLCLALAGCFVRSARRTGAQTRLETNRAKQEPVEEPAAEEAAPSAPSAGFDARGAPRRTSALDGP